MSGTAVSPDVEAQQLALVRGVSHEGLRLEEDKGGGRVALHAHGDEVAGDLPLE